MATKIVLHNGEHDEVELGPFNQGVVFKIRPGNAQVIVEDVASGKIIAWSEGHGWRCWDGVKRYHSIFVHEVPAIRGRTPTAIHRDELALHEIGRMDEGSLD